ncbi:11774_t:CDS:2 [Paraglomus brasilianum]|uniref:11774_t:CDS:1 n=1 Tax=Paraglomus brasilianum TaxID=144538 RepID=A0A9N9D9A4_9GLOM|nr:11774_t:CDS:2 [Paraglomus brasilianum]
MADNVNIAALPNTFAESFKVEPLPLLISKYCSRCGVTPLRGKNTKVFNTCNACLKDENTMRYKETKRRRLVETFKQVQNKFQKLRDEKNLALRNLKAAQSQNAKLESQFKRMEKRIAELETKEWWDKYIYDFDYY